ncbi:MAG TPA: hypothetical protein VJU16_09085, partial [Planctomycetota bacterium]|nr:hypothetical protein [Planctomycetota bacterium]
MNRLARAQRLWMGRRLALLGGSAAATAAALVLLVVRLRLEPNGAAVYGVALLVTLIVFAILLRLVRLQMAGPGLEAPSWERHGHRASLREAPLVALVGTAVVAFMIAVTPRLIAEERSAAASRIAVQVSEPGRRARSVPPVQAFTVPAVVASAKKPGALDVYEPSPIPFDRPVEVNYRWLDGTQEEPQEYHQEPVDPTRPGRDSILRIEAGAPPLPPIHFGVGALLAFTNGDLDLAGDGGRFQLDLDKIRGEQTVEMGLDVTAELALTPESALKVMYAGIAIVERGHLTENTSFGSGTAQAGDRYQFDLTWSHLYIALAKRLTGYTRDSSFDLSVHVGAMVDHTLAEFEVADSGVGAESEDGERGWFAPGVGFSVSVRGPGPAGFTLEFAQSVPVNIGGQAINLTDIRGGVTADLSEAVSLFVGY